MAQSVSLREAFDDFVADKQYQGVSPATISFYSRNWVHVIRDTGVEAAVELTCARAPAQGAYGYVPRALRPRPRARACRTGSHPPQRRVGAAAPLRRRGRGRRPGSSPPVAPRGGAGAAAPRRVSRPIRLRARPAPEADAAIAGPSLVRARHAAARAEPGGRHAAWSATRAADLTPAPCSNRTTRSSRRTRRTDDPRCGSGPASCHAYLYFPRL
jgi:hypothetical protein